jgi:hypothetical protein
MKFFDSHFRSHLLNHYLVAWGKGGTHKSKERTHLDWSEWWVGPNPALKMTMENWMKAWDGALLKIDTFLLCGKTDLS